MFDLHKRPMQEVFGAYKGDGPWDDDLRDIEGCYLNDSGIFVVGEFEGKIVAMGAYKKSADGYAEIKRMRVYPEHQGKGFGREILCHLERCARENGYKGFILETSVYLYRAQKLYTAHGFVEIKREAIDGLDCIWYVKEFV